MDEPREGLDPLHRRLVNRKRAEVRKSPTRSCPIRRCRRCPSAARPLFAACAAARARPRHGCQGASAVALAAQVDHYEHGDDRDDRRSACDAANQPQCLRRDHGVPPIVILFLRGSSVPNARRCGVRQVLAPAHGESRGPLGAARRRVRILQMPLDARGVGDRVVVEDDDRAVARERRRPLRASSAHRECSGGIGVRDGEVLADDRDRQHPLRGKACMRIENVLAPLVGARGRDRPRPKTKHRGDCEPLNGVLDANPPAIAPMRARRSGRCPRPR